MDILMTGRLACATAPLSGPLLRNHKVVYASNDLVESQLGKGVTPFHISPHERDFERIFHSYHFKVAVFFCQPLYAKEEYYREYEDLEAFLQLCAKHDVNQVLYIQPKLYGQDYTKEVLPDHDLAMLFASCEQLCNYYRQRRAMSVIVCRTPVLYGYGETASLIGEAILQARSKASIHFKGADNQRCAFLSQKDMGELLLRMIESWTTQYETIDIPALSVMTFAELGGYFKQHYPTLRLSYQQLGGITADIIPDSGIPKKEYDWIAIYSLPEELPELIAAQEGTPEKEAVSLLHKVRNFIKKHSFIVKLAELVLGFILMELLNRVTSTTIQFQYIDFRLLYIVLMGTLHGMRTGLAAAGLASLSMLASAVVTQNNWAATAYDIDTWLPFIFFFLIGSVTGYVKDRLRNDNRFLSEEKAILEDKYVLLNEFYMSALQNKDKYKTQIMSYRDSFGRLFDITKSLDSTLVDEVFREALNALEGVLENKAVCIYSCDEKMLFGRLIVCSKEIRDVTEKSLNLSKLERMTAEFKDGEVWANRERLLGYPEYAVPIYRDEKPIALIVLQKVSYDQLAVYYENLVKIICGLIKISLVRALEYTEQIEDEMYLPDSRIVSNGYFSQIIQVKEEMAEIGVSEYVLIRFNTTPQNILSVGNRLNRLIRQTDILGLGRDGELYLCLSQTNQSNIHIVLDRIKKSGLSFHEMNAGGAI